MGRNSSINTRFFLFWFTLRWLTCFLRLAIAADTLLSNQSIKDGEILISANKRFQLRFFSPFGDTHNYNGYVGIWLDTGEFSFGNLNKTVWVANRENALNNTTGILSLTTNGNLVVSYGTGGNVVWSTNLTAARPTTNGSVAKLEDNGKLVVREVDSGAVLWESFDHPCDTLLPGMKIGINLRTGWSRVLTAWRSEYDPAPGIYSFGIDPQDLNQFFLWRRTIPYSRILFWNGSSFSTIVYAALLDNSIHFSIVPHSHDEVHLTLSPPLSGLSWVVIKPSASLKSYFVSPRTVVSVGISPRISCNSDCLCGPQSSCNDNEEPICKCLPGNKPISQAEWNLRKWSSGCMPRLELQCGGKDGYLTLKKVKLPDPSYYIDAINASTCRQECDDKECSCKAWALINDDRCQIYTEEIYNLEEDADDDDKTGSMLSEVNIRVVSSVLSREGRRCGTCGTNIIPYPLSTAPTCGDPAYGSFFCDSSSGLLHFLVSNVTSYIVSSIKPETRTFVIKPQGIDLCWAGSDQRMDIHLNSSLPFHVSNNNTILLLNCSIVAPDKMSHLNCNSSSPCHRYIQEGGAPCFRQKRCCSYITRGLNSNTSHGVGVLESECGAYASIHNLNSSTLSIIDWKEGVQIEWDAPPEPVCDWHKDCNGWPNSSCRVQKSAIRGKRCLCNENFLWDPLSMNCTPGGHSNNKSLVVPTGSKKNKHLVRILIVTPTATAGIFLFIVFIYYVQQSKTRRKGLPAYDFLQLASGNDIVEVPMVDFKCITKATDNFSNSNKLGRGSFGPVYKGVLLGGQEIAIKKLSRCSRQGLEEFKNEVLLIAKLQHRNLVRMLGYCTEEDEKMLIYEYMPNRSLDFFLFDLDRHTLLDWEKRFNIILGVTRGLLYLHQDSRLRIIHRDLKTSNILLDKDMSPKISDFGLARIIGGDQNQETTNRVAGTYGYMAPEYAADGLFSVKSDVFSFGIIMLEIVSGRKNAGFYNDENASNLTGYACHLWKEERGFNLLDPSLCDLSNLDQVLRCIHLALLCVQENAEDRPTMAYVLIALETEEVNLPAPREPAFFRSGFPIGRPALNKKRTCSNNSITLSTVEGR